MIPKEFALIKEPTIIISVAISVIDCSQLLTGRPTHADLCRPIVCQVYPRHCWTELTCATEINGFIG